MPAKRQHYVPQFLLRNFALERNRVYVFDKWKDEVRVQSTADSAVEKYFYDHEENRSEALERNLARLECDTANILHRIVSSESLFAVAETDRKWILAFFVATQMLRTRREREFSKRHWDIFKEAVKSEGFRETWVGGLEEDWDAVEMDFAQQHLSNMRLTASFFSVTLEEYRWFLLKAPRDEVFFISDHPAVVWNSRPSPEVGLGLFEEGAEVYLPVAPHLTLLVAEPTCEIAAMGNIPLEANNDSTLRASAGAMRLLNGLQVSSSERFVFANKNDFEIAREILEYNPEWREGPKPELDEVLDFLRFANGEG